VVETLWTGCSAFCIAGDSRASVRQADLGCWSEPGLQVEVPASTCHSMLGKRSILRDRPTGSEPPLLITSALRVQGEFFRFPSIASRLTPHPVAVVRGRHRRQSTRTEVDEMDHQACTPLVSARVEFVEAQCLPASRTDGEIRSAKSTSPGPSGIQGKIGEYASDAKRLVTNYPV
jgi:hypothetical protein